LPADPIERCGNLFEQLRVVFQIQLRISVLAGGSINVGNKTPTVAMTQQGGDSGRRYESAPQKLLHLVGCRDPNARPKPWVRPRPVLEKP